MRLCRSIFKRGRIWWGKYKIPFGKIIRISLETDNKQIAEKKLLDIYKEAEQELYGLIPPKLLRQSSEVLIKKHLEDYLADLTVLERDDKYISNGKFRLKKLLKFCGWQFLRDVSADSFLRWRSRQRKLSGRTLNHYLAHAQSFFAWLVSAGRLAGNPLSGVQRIDTRGRETVVRRALNHEELRRLCSVEGRGLIYFFAAFTGLRRSEIKLLRWADVVLDGTAVPHLRVRASTAKNRKNAALPLHPALAERLRIHRSGLAVLGGCVFPTMPTSVSVNRDLLRCGIAQVDSDGRKVDFHALRVTFATMLNLAGASPRSAMDLMRHSDMRLTHLTYTDTTALPLLAEVSKLTAF